MTRIESASTADNVRCVREFVVSETERPALSSSPRSIDVTEMSDQQATRPRAKLGQEKLRRQFSGVEDSWSTDRAWIARRK